MPQAALIETPISGSVTQATEPPRTPGTRRVIVTSRTGTSTAITPTIGTIANTYLRVRDTIDTVTASVISNATWAEVTNCMDDIYINFVSDTRPISIWTGNGWNTSTTCSQWIIQNWDYPNAAQILQNGNFQCAKKYLRPDPRPIRSAIKKGIKLITGLGFGDEIKVFLGGSSVEVSHPESEFKFVLTKSRDIMDATRYPGYSTPYKLELYTKTNVFISKLCVIMEQTPVLDQVLAMIMFIRSGDEDIILKTANYPGLTQDRELRGQLALRHPHLRHKFA